jgi:hypothetical protein
MSISSLANDAILKSEKEFLRSSLGPRIDRHAQVMAEEYNIDQAARPAFGEKLLTLAAETPTDHTRAQVVLDSQTSNALDGLAKYIPVEALTLYVAATSVMPSITKAFAGLSAEAVYWFFVVLTPTLFLLVFIGKRKAAGMPPFPDAIGKWPWWKLSASTIAFLIWALAIPSTPYLSGDAGKVVAAFGALLISTVLKLLEPIFDGP